MIYADPPWRYNRKDVKGAAESHYPTMDIDALISLPVADLAAPDCVLFMWATFPQMPTAILLIKEWGFQYKSVGFVWLKKNRKADSWFKGWGFGHGAMQKCACWQHGGIHEGRLLMSINSLFHLLRNIAKSQMRPEAKLLH